MATCQMPRATSTPLTAADATSQRAAKPFRAGSPNVVVIVLDDTGFAQLGCYGSDIATPTIDGLAADGVRLTNFHTTAVCSPTRACLLTGRNHHRVGMGMLPDLPMAFPGYTARIPSSAGTMAEILRASGYATFLVGKWHLTPRDERSPSGPFTNWPLAKGFEHYYGFLGGDANHWAPELVRDNTYVDPPRTPEEGYHLTEDLADEFRVRVRELRRNQPARPFFMWLALGATHAPHQVQPEWVEPYRGQFDRGWDRWRAETLSRQIELGIVPPTAELPNDTGHIAPWDGLGAEERRLYARMMELFAGFLTHTDAQIAKVLATLDDLGERDNTIVMLVSDNGASGEGGPHGSVSEFRFAQGRSEDLDLNLRMIDELGGHRTYNHYPWGWAEAGNTPVRRFKRYTFEGGVRDPFIVSWPAGLRPRGELRHQYCHAIDVLPTVLEMVDVPVPAELNGVEQMSLDGVSMWDMWQNADAPDPRTSQYFECWGSRAMYEDGWKVVTNHVNQLTHADRELIEGSDDFANDRWLLYNYRDDPAENHDLADEHPEIAQRLIDRWFEEAERNGVLPLSDGLGDRLAHLFTPWPSGSSRVELLPGERVFEDCTPVLCGGFTMTVELDEPWAHGHVGVVAEQGDYNGGWVLHCRDGALVFAVAFVSEYLTEIESPLPVGSTQWKVVGRPRSGGVDIAVIADGAVIGSGHLPHEWPGLWTPNSAASLLAGMGRPLPVYDGYDPTVAFGGAMRSLVVAADGGTVDADIERQIEVAFRAQ